MTQGLNRKYMNWNSKNWKLNLKCKFNFQTSTWRKVVSETLTWMVNFMIKTWTKYTLTTDSVCIFGPIQNLSVLTIEIAMLLYIFAFHKTHFNDISLLVYFEYILNINGVKTWDIWSMFTLILHKKLPVFWYPFSNFQYCISISIILSCSFNFLMQNWTLAVELKTQYPISLL